MIIVQVSRKFYGPPPHIGPCKLLYSRILWFRRARLTFKCSHIFSISCFSGFLWPSLSSQLANIQVPWNKRKSHPKTLTPLALLWLILKPWVLSLSGGKCNFVGPCGLHPSVCGCPHGPHGQETVGKWDTRGVGGPEVESPLAMPLGHIVQLLSRPLEWLKLWIPWMALSLQSADSHHTKTFVLNFSPTLPVTRSSPWGLQPQARDCWPKEGLFLLLKILNSGNGSIYTVDIWIKSWVVFWGHYGNSVNSGNETFSQLLCWRLPGNWARGNKETKMRSLSSRQGRGLRDSKLRC